MSTYFLHTERIGFRIWSESDLDLALGLWGDPEVTRLIGGPFSAAQVRDRLQREIRIQREHGVQYWPIFLRASGEHVGCCGLRPYGEDCAIREIGFHLRRAYWGSSLGAEAACAVIDYAFTELGSAGLFAGHNPANDASRRLLARLGFRYTHDEYYAPTGFHHPSYLLRVEEWKRLRV
jgi:RimJ/RimL family protein N-acetyltransferase